MNSAFFRYHNLRVIVRFVFLLSLFGCHSSNFPTLSTGSYIGSVNGLVLGSDERFSLYAEAMENSHTLLFVIFGDGWTPQLLKVSDEASPLVLSHEGVSYTLRGSSHGTTYSGSIAGTNGVKGEWSLERLNSGEFKRDIDYRAPDFDLVEWLTVKARFNIVADEMSDLRVTHEQEMGKFEKLERFVKNESVLRDRSKSRKDALATELNKITEQRKKNTNDLKSALNDLALINRASTEGQLVDINRRIEKRENKWYALNWAGSFEDANVEEELAAQDQVDLNKLNAAAKKAEEIVNLERSIEEEQQKIRELRAQSNTSIHVVERPSASEQPIPGRDEKPWWKVWDNSRG